MSDLAKRMDDLIKASHTSYGKLEKFTGVSKSVLQRYATGITEKFSIDNIVSIANALNVSPAYLLGWEESENNNSHQEKISIIAEEILQLVNSFPHSLQVVALEQLRSLASITEIIPEEK